MGAREVQEDFINQGTKREVFFSVQWLCLHQEHTVLLADKMLLLLKKLKYDTEVHKQSLHEMKSASHKIAGYSRKSMDVESQGLSGYCLWNPR